MTIRILLVPIVCGLVTGSLPAQPPRPLDSIAAKLEPTSSLVYKTVNDRQLQMHLFEPHGHQASDSRSVLLMIHGGGWTGGDPRSVFPIADYFARRNMIGVSLEYRLLNREAGVTVFDCVGDACSAVRYLRVHAEQLGIDPRRIVVAGASAGGHLAAATSLFDAVDPPSDEASMSCRADALVLYYPVIDISSQGYGQPKIGQRWRELSPLHHVQPGLPPTIIFHGTADTVTPYRGVTKFHQRMKQLGNHCQLVSHRDGAHGYFIFDLTLYEQVMNRTHRFLDSLGMIDR